MGRRKKFEKPCACQGNSWEDSEIKTLYCSMECLGKKRKGIEISSAHQEDGEEQTRLAVLLSHFSLEDYSRRKKKCKEVAVSKIVDLSRSVVNGVATAPACGTSHLECPGRGLKRKIGCIEAATRLGRKKKIEQEYELAKTIGRGKFGSVVLCQSKTTGEEFACKTLRKGEEIVHREVEIMQHLSGHRGVVTLKAVYEDAESFHLVMELCSEGRLADQMAREGQYSEQKAANIIKELMIAVRYCHEMGVVHRDIKPENILLTTSGQMKLADFGLAMRILDGQNLTGVVGSPAYVAPEVLLGNYSEKVDIWSAGVLLHALLVGVLPFQGDSLDAVFDAIKKEKLDFKGGVWDSISQPARDLLSKMLTRNVSTRFSANEVLRHPWISFYTEPTLTPPTLKPYDNPTLTPKQLTHTHRTESERKRLICHSSLSDDSSLTSASAYSTEVVEGEDEGLVDILAVAISRVRISEPKRSRICSPSRPIQQECSSNLKTSNLCTAF
ncbi:Ca2+/calmodulin-dependent protein kinase, EF-Hand protein superfamily [Handroanthus impetiginosus]|uniref:Ca2+/calmodulin-dependent protein kinase, EF-Hand protein superfamily n=1 Tax=Handroanthus impetiginosus TaxID=429701 RepID=A0A2G9HJS2_9LAMI|nr:Ca2+/calmodulin-dependent protein kinase, EF-Hand protein superfamily [Handroanthus impetiginosus]